NLISLWLEKVANPSSEEQPIRSTRKVTVTTGYTADGQRKAYVPEEANDFPRGSGKNKGCRRGRDCHRALPACRDPGPALCVVGRPLGPITLPHKRPRRSATRGAEPQRRCTVPGLPVHKKQA